MKYLEKFDFFKKKLYIEEDIIEDIKDICLELRDELKDEGFDYSTFIDEALNYKTVIIKASPDGYPMSFEVNDVIRDVLERIERYVSDKGIKAEISYHTYRIEIVYKRK